MQNITLTEAQKKIVKSKARFKTIRAGRRFGKSWLSAWEMFAMATAKETKQIYFAPTYEEAYNIMWHELIAIAEPAIERKNETRMEVWIKNMDGTTSYIRLSGWDLKVADRVRGQKYHHVWVDEVAKMRDFIFYWQNAVLPTLIDYNGGATFLSTPRGFNHFYDLCNRDGKDWEHFHFTSYDNPHLPEGAVASLLEELGPEAESQEILAEFTKQQGLVYNEFERVRHVKEQPFTQTREIIVGVDFGYTHPAAIVELLTDGIRYHVRKVWYEVGRTHEEIADVLINMSGMNALYPDPASPEAIAVLQRKNLPVREVVKGHDSVMTGINKVKELLRTNRLTINPTGCDAIIKEFDMYVWEEDKDKPIKEYDHSLDALRYALMMHQAHVQPLNSTLLMRNRQKPNKLA